MNPPCCSKESRVTSQLHPCLAQTRWERQQTLAQSGVLICQQLHLLTLPAPKVSTFVGTGHNSSFVAAAPSSYTFCDLFLFEFQKTCPHDWFHRCHASTVFFSFPVPVQSQSLMDCRNWRLQATKAWSFSSSPWANAMVALAHLICWVWIVGARYSKSISTEWLILLSEHGWISKPIRDIPSKGMFCCLPSHPWVSNMNSKPRY